MDEEWLPQVLLLGPGGVKGFTLLGGLRVLEAYDYLRKVDTYTGVSVGALIALLLTIGLKSKDILNIAIDTNIFEDLESISLDKIHEVRHHVGLISNEPIRRRLEGILIDKFSMVPTLRQLYLCTGLVFVCVTLNTDKDEVEYKSAETSPDDSVLDVVMLSMNVPLLFYRIFFKNDNYVDGALGNPYPIDYFDDGKTNILGMYILTEYENNETDVKKIANLPVSVYIHKVIQASMDQHRIRIMQGASNRCRHIALPTRLPGTTGFNAQLEDKARMLIRGYEVTKNFIHAMKENRYVPNIPKTKIRKDAPYYHLIHSPTGEIIISNP